MGSRETQSQGKCQKPSGQVDRCVSSICLAPGVWQMGAGDQAAGKTWDPSGPAALPRLKAERFQWAAMQPVASGCFQPESSITATSNKAWFCRYGIVGPSERPLACETPCSALCSCHPLLHFSPCISAFRGQMTLRYVPLPDGSVSQRADLSF